MQLHNRQEWLEYRRKILTASDCGTVLGCNPYSGPRTLYETKVNGYETPETDAMRIGKALEPEIARMFSAETGIEVIDPGEYTIAMHPTVEWLGATLDRMTNDVHNAPVELKSVQTRGVNPDDWARRPPDSHLVQLQVQMQCVGAEHGYLVGLFPHYQLRIHKTECDDEFFSAALDEFEKFWKRVQEKDPPAADETPSSEAVLKWLHPKDNGETIILDDKAARLTYLWQKAKHDKAVAAQQEKACRTMLLDKMGDALWGELPDGSFLTLPTITRKGYTVEPSEYRKLGFKENK